MRGRVLKSTGSWYLLEDENGIQHQARIRGKLRLDKNKNTNPVAVGDWVVFLITDESGVVISKIEKRKNYIIRKSVNLSKQTHIIASNIDLACLVITIAYPKVTYGFIDRFLVTAKSYGIAVTLVVNKTDLWEEQHKIEAEELKNVYEKIGYEVLFLSVEKNEGVTQLKEKLKNKVSLFSGHSGVGKSSLINLLHPELQIKTDSISSYNEKGQHTTTFAHMHAWPFGGYIIDTPGIKEFGLVEMSKHEIQDYFPEIFAYKNQCKFNNCLHLNEPGCVVQKAVENGEIHLIRFNNYLSFLED